MLFAINDEPTCTANVYNNILHPIATDTKVVPVTWFEVFIVKIQESLPYILISIQGHHCFVLRVFILMQDIHSEQSNDNGQPSTMLEQPLDYTLGEVSFFLILSLLCICWGLQCFMLVIFC